MKQKPLPTKTVPELEADMNRIKARLTRLEADAIERGEFSVSPHGASRAAESTTTYGRKRRRKNSTPRRDAVRHESQK